MADKNNDSFRGLSHEVGARLAEQRAALAKTLRVVASEAEISAGHLSDIENGRSQVSLPVLLRLTKALDLSVGELLPQIGGHRSTSGSFNDLTHGTTVLSHQELELSIRHVALAGEERLPLENPTLEDLFIYVLSGTITVDANGQQITLADGDSIDSERLSQCEVAAVSASNILITTRIPVTKAI